MKIEDGKVALIHYTLTDDEGTVLDSSDGGDPLGYLHGAGNIIDGLEAALNGRGAGESFEIRIAPEDAYGVHDDAKVQEVPRASFDGIDSIEPGMQFQAETPEGLQIVRVIAVTDDTVRIDGNHPLADQALSFAVEVVEVRDATEEEAKHGHVHGDGGHQH